MAFATFRERKFSKANVPKLQADQTYTCEVDQSRLVNNETTQPDVFFYFSDTEDKNMMCAHFCILKVRCPQMLEGSIYRKKKGHVINLSKVKKAIASHVLELRRVLVYLYCGQIDFASFTLVTAVGMVHIAIVYGIQHLYEVISKYIYDHLMLENVFEVLTYASILGIEQVKKICFDFAMQNLDFFSIKEAKTLGFEIYQEAVAVLTTHYQKGEKHASPDMRETAVDPIVDNFKSLFNSRNETGDLTFIVQGKIVKAHKCILLAHSLLLDELIMGSSEQILHTTLNPHAPHNSYSNGVGNLGLIHIDQSKFSRISEEGFEDMLRFFYFNQQILNPLNVCHLVEFAKHFELNKLLRCLEHNITSSPITLQSAPYMLEVAFTHLDDNAETKERALSYIIEHMDEIDFQALEAMPAIIAATILTGVQKIILLSSNSSKEVDPPANHVNGDAQKQDLIPTKSKTSRRSKERKAQRKSTKM